MGITNASTDKPPATTEPNATSLLRSYATATNITTKCCAVATTTNAPLISLAVYLNSFARFLTRSCSFIYTKIRAAAMLVQLCSNKARTAVFHANLVNSNNKK